MIPDPIATKYDPHAKRRFKVGKVENNAKKTLVITEVRRPDPQACLLLKEGETVELTNDEVRILLHQDQGPLIPRDLLTEVVATKAAPVDPAAASAPEPKGKGK